MNVKKYLKIKLSKIHLKQRSGTIINNAAYKIESLKILLAIQRLTTV